MMVWGELMGHLEREGKTMPAIDSLIAASVLEGEFTLVTRNENDLKDAGIPIVNPWRLP
jgi:tRNA(fMet)-specific endonuclease VapC